MTTTPWGDDEALLAELREAVAEAGEVTDDMRSAALAAYSWRTIDAELELASLVFDSDVDEGALVRSGSSDRPRTLLFERAGIGIYLELTRDALIGQLTPPSGGDVVVQGMDEETRLSADGAGMFSLRPGPLRLFRVLTSLDGHRMATDWIMPR
jgi:hypothetical protein